MRAIVDENVPAAFVRSLTGAGTIVERFPKSWKGLQNGRLLERLAAEGFDCLVTCDKNLVHQQSFAGKRPSVLVLPATKLAQLEPLTMAVADALSALQIGQVAALELNGTLTVS